MPEKGNSETMSSVNSVLPLLVAGSVAFDSIRTPFGVRERSLGGAALHFSVSASYFTDVAVVAVIGDDFTDEDEEVFRERRINTENLQRVAGGRTFRFPIG
jgi:sugar/nucleoside kinase (ribokinase family)